MISSATEIHDRIGITRKIKTKRIKSNRMYNAITHNVCTSKQTSSSTCGEQKQHYCGHSVAVFVFGGGLA